MAHGLDFILECASLVQQDHIHFLLMGEGAMKTRLIAQKNQLGLTNVTILDGIPKSEVPLYIALGDISLINLRRKNTFTKVIPSKIFENAAMLKPILLGVEGEACQIVSSYHAGECFEPENTESFLDTLNLMLENDNLQLDYREGSRKLASDFSRTTLAVAMLRILNDLVDEKLLIKEASKTSLAN